jgi:hypothetical protein
VELAACVVEVVIAPPPAAGLEALEACVLVVPPLLDGVTRTLKVAFDAEDGPNLVLPEYFAVTVCAVPIGALAALHEALPAERLDEQSLVDPMVKLTVPVGLPPPELTVAV